MCMVQNMLTFCLPMWIFFYQNIQIPPTGCQPGGARQGREATNNNKNNNRNIRSFFGLVYCRAAAAAATEFVEKCCFPRISENTLGSVSARFWNSAEQQQQATEFVENCCFPRISDNTLSSFPVWYSAEEQQHQQQATEFVQKCCFPTISEDTLGSFSARSWDYVVFQGHGAFLPAAVFF